MDGRSIFQLAPLLQNTYFKEVLYMPGRSSGLRMTADDDSVHVRMGYKGTSHKKF